jgi:transposase-like protein
MYKDEKKKRYWFVCYLLEISFTYLGRVKYQDWIFGGIERPYKVIRQETPMQNEDILSSVYVYDTTVKMKVKCFMERVANRSEEELLSIIRRRIKPKTIIVSDCWKSYINLPDYGYIHYTVNHSKNFINPVTGACTNSIEGSWHLFRCSLPSRGVKMSVIYLYMAEFLYMMMIEKKLQTFLFDLYNFKFEMFKKVQEIFEDVRDSEIKTFKESNKIRGEIWKEKGEQKKIGKK